MSTKLSDLYPWCSDRHVQNKVTLLLDSQIPGANHTAEFLLTSFLLRYLSPKAARDQISNAQANIVMILYPKQLYQNDQLHFIHFHANAEDKPTTSFSPTASSNESHMTFEELEAWSQSHFPWPLGASFKPFLLLVDDVDVMELLVGASGRARLRQWLSNLIRHVQNSDKLTPNLEGAIFYGRTPAESQLTFPSMDSALPQQHLDHSEGHRAPLVEGMGVGAGGEPLLVEYLRYRQVLDRTSSAHALKSGPSSLVHGIIRIYDRNQVDASAAAQREVTLQYKALDTGVVCSPAS
eukprot:gene26482-32006_t